MKRISFFFLIFQFLSVLVFSQNSNGGLINQVRVLATRDAKFVLDYRDVDGSPYYTSDFIKGDVYLKDGNFASQKLRYDIFRDEIEFLKENKIYWLKKNDIKFVRYGSEMVILTHSVSDSSQLGYFFLTSTGNYRLLCKKMVDFYPEVPAKGYAETVPARFKREVDVYFIQFEGNPAWKVGTRTELLSVFEANKKATDFIKKERIKTTKSGDLEKLVTFLNTK